METATYDLIRKLMREEGIWSFTMQYEVYTVEELFKAVGEERFSEQLKKLLRENVHQVQCALDSRIIVPIKNKIS